MFYFSLTSVNPDSSKLFKALRDKYDFQIDPLVDDNWQQSPQTTSRMEWRIYIYINASFFKHILYIDCRVWTYLYIMWNLNVKFSQRRFSHTEIPGTILHALILAKSSGGIKKTFWYKKYYNSTFWKLTM